MCQTAWQVTSRAQKETYNVHKKGIVARLIDEHFLLKLSRVAEMMQMSSHHVKEPVRPDSCFYGCIFGCINIHRRQQTAVSTTRKLTALKAMHYKAKLRLKAFCHFDTNYFPSHLLVASVQLSFQHINEWRLTVKCFSETNKYSAVNTNSNKGAVYTIHIDIVTF